jgi:hypothetical protein
MVKQGIWIGLVWLLLAGVGYGQMMAGGTIVKMISSDLVFIDKGADVSVSIGDLYDIVADETVYHPLTDSVLAVTTQTVGAIKILQLFPKTALARLVYLQMGEDPMLKEIVPIRDPERIAEIESRMMRDMRGVRGGLSRRMAVVPGLYQLNMGARRKGWVLMGLEAASLVAGLTYRASSNDWKDQYDRLTNPGDDFDRYINGANDRRKSSNRYFRVAALVFVYNWFDVLWEGRSLPLNLKLAEPRRLQFGAGVDQGGNSVLQMVHRF